MMRKRFAVVAAVVAAMALSGCSSDQTGALTVKDGYVKATDAMSKDATTGKYMTGAFMVIANGLNEDVTVTGGSSDIAPMVEVHEVVNGKMQKKEGGLPIPAGTSAELKPGGNHIMLMGMTEPLSTGAEVALELTLANGKTLSVTLPVKVVNVEQEHYHSPSPSMSK